MVGNARYSRNTAGRIGADVPKLPDAVDVAKQQNGDAMDRLNCEYFSIRRQRRTGHRGSRANGNPRS